MGNWHSEMQFSKATMRGDKRVEGESHEHAVMLCPLLCRVVLASCLLNLRLFGASPSTPLSLNLFGRKEAESSSLLVQGTGDLQETPYTFLAGCSGLCVAE